MNFIEFRKRVNLIVAFAVRLNEEHIPNDIKRIIVKIYADTLLINLSDKMADSLIGPEFLQPKREKQVV
jgi:hypothetical protein